MSGERVEVDWRAAERRVRRVIDDLHEIAADLELNRDQGWPATKISYCAGGLVNLLAYPPQPSDKEEHPDRGSEVEIQRAAEAIKSRCCSFGDEGTGWADQQYLRVAREILEAAREGTHHA